jgi:hypothetical protein
MKDGTHLSFREGLPTGEFYDKILLFNEWGEAEIFAQCMELKNFNIRKVNQDD